MTKNHKLDFISIGENSPYRILPQYDGKILMIGCGLKPNTFMHGVENASNAPYRETKYRVQYQMEDENGNNKSYEGGLPDMSGYAQRYDRVADILLSQQLTTFPLLQAECHLIDAQALMTVGVETIKKDPYYFVDKI